jgi:hypothetical protein
VIKKVGLIELLKVLERRTSITAHTTDSVSLVTAKRLRRLTEYSIRRLQAGFGHSRLLRETSKMAGAFNHVDALVLGNGPSIRQLNIDSVRIRQELGMHLITVNWFPLSDLGRHLVPDFLVLSDPSMMPSPITEGRVAELWSVLRGQTRTRLVVPTTWKRSVERFGIAREAVIYFNDLPLEGFGRGTSPLRPRRYLSMTVYKALAVATFFEYRQVCVLGVDNTMYQGLRVDQDNELLVGDHHFYSKQRPDTNMTDFYPNGVADFFYDISLCFLDLRRFFGGSTNFVNLDPTSLVDCFRKDDPLGLTVTSR